MQDPVRGEFAITDRYYPHPGRVPMQEMLTGVVTAAGVAPTPAEVLNDLSHGKAIGRDVLPVLIDRSDVSKVQVLWDELPVPDPRADARAAAAREAERMQHGGSTAGPTVSLGKPGAGHSDTDDGQSGWARDLVAGLVADGTLAGIDPDTVTVQVEPSTVTYGGSGVPGMPPGFGVGGGEPRESASAVVTGVAEVMVRPQDLPGPGASMCDVTMTVTRADGSSYTASTRQGFRTPERRAALATVGARVPVTLAPRNPADVRIDVYTWFAQHPGN